MLLDFVSILLVFIYFYIKNKKNKLKKFLTDKKEGGCYKMIGCNFYMSKNSSKDNAIARSDDN